MNARHADRIARCFFLHALSPPQGKRDASGSVGGSRTGATHQHQGNQPAPVSSADFLAANEAAAAAWDQLPARYKTRRLKAQQLDVIELGGAENYESKKKAKA